MTYSFKKRFSIYLILSALLAISSCTCGSNEPAGDLSSKTITILLCTANVQYFKGVQPTAVLKPLADLRQTTDNLVFIGLQETPTNMIEDIKRAFPEYQVEDYRGAGANLANSLVVFNKLKLKINPQHIDLPKPQHAGRRYATIVHLPDINFTVANTHILGGRFDDAQWYLYPNIRNEQIKAILTYNPTIVMGDFNADNTPNVIIKSGGYLEKNLKLGIGADKDSAQVEKDFRNYMFGLHTELAQQAYVSLLTEQDIKYTVKRGSSQGIVDWVYAAKKFTQVKGYEVIDRGIIRAIDQGLSDHDFPWIRIRIKDPRQ